MRLSIASIAALAISTFEVAVASNCWASTLIVLASYGPLDDLRTNAMLFCNLFSSNVTSVVHSSGGYGFGHQSAAFIGTFANYTSCVSTFNKLVTDCYGPGPTLPITLGGSIHDAGGARLAISFGNGVEV
ncbi:hypothetical protein CVT26_012033 [Gymnopilus dilepis]|uniref:Carboxylic ester hydrolase n=1 Tax=Gymnopilus dilepis TaxID=231916 RepID=A0A409WNZ9_9AGAR|nr:hypothetical protein CVT26_012033 [Gymnopilus dilepis]